MNMHDLFMRTYNADRVAFSGQLRWQKNKDGKLILQQEYQASYWDGSRESHWVDVPVVDEGDS